MTAPVNSSGFAVTPADVQRVAQKYMKNIRFVVLGNPQSIDTGVFTGQAG